MRHDNHRAGKSKRARVGAGVRILYRDDFLVAVDKPAGLLVHRTEIAAETRAAALQQVRDLLGTRVYSIHRLDRPASGVLLFGLTPEAARAVSCQLEAGRVVKTYLAVVRGWPQSAGTIDYPLSDGPGQPLREAVTRYHVLARVEVPVAVGRYPTSRYALLEVRPLSGRYHQIRRHLHHVFHPLIGDTTHGEGRHNRFFRDALGIPRLLLHARALAFAHPASGDEIRIQAPLDGQWLALLTRIDWVEEVKRDPSRCVSDVP